MTRDEILCSLRDETRELACQIDGMIEGIGVSLNATSVGLFLICSWPPGSATRMPETIDRVCHWLRSRSRDDQPLTAAWDEAYKAYEGWVGLRGREQEDFLFNEIPREFEALSKCLCQIADDSSCWPSSESSHPKEKAITTSKKDHDAIGTPSVPAQLPEQSLAPAVSEPTDAEWQAWVLVNHMAHMGYNGQAKTAAQLIKQKAKGRSGKAVKWTQGMVSTAIQTVEKYRATIPPAHWRGVKKAKIHQYATDPQTMGAVTHAREDEKDED